MYFSIWIFEAFYETLQFLLPRYCMLDKATVTLFLQNTYYFCYAIPLPRPKSMPRVLIPKTMAPASKHPSSKKMNLFLLNI